MGRGKMGMIVNKRERTLIEHGAMGKMRLQLNKQYLALYVTTGILRLAQT